MLKNTLIISGSNAYGVACTFLRGVLLARILGPHDFGLALIVLSVVSALDLFADAGIDKFIVQNRFGYRSDIISTSHAFRVTGSATFAALICLLAYPLSLLFHAPELTIPIALTGGVVGLRGLSNLSYKLQQRTSKFGKEAAIDLSRFSLDIALTTLVAIYSHSFYAVIIGSYANAITQLIASHFLSPTAYSAFPRKRLLPIVGHFSIPIYLNAILLFAAVQGDRFVVAASFSKSQLAFYSAACALGQGVSTLIQKVVTNQFLPLMSNAAIDPQLKRRRIASLGLLTIVGSCLFLATISIAGPLTVQFLYGPKFSQLGPIIFASSVVQMIQLEQAWLTTLLLANGLTRKFPMITIVRAIALPIAIVFIHFGVNIIAIPAAFAVGAACSLLTSYFIAWPLKVLPPWIPVLSAVRLVLVFIVIIALVIGWHPG